MSYRRTRHDKESASRPFAIHWEKSANFEENLLSVKGKNSVVKANNKLKNGSSKLSNNMAQGEDIVRIKVELFKSLVTASLILASEVVLYSFWRG